jgi:hypothetical protein
MLRLIVWGRNIFSRNFRQVNLVPLQRCQSVTMAQIHQQAKHIK